jgi:hypothetical protein
LDLFLTIFRWTVGLSDGANPDYDNSWIGRYQNSYAIPTGRLSYCLLAGDHYQFELPEGVIQTKLKDNRSNFYGCGLVLDPEDKLWIFFTLNGQLMGEFVLEFWVARILRPRTLHPIEGFWSQNK